METDVKYLSPKTGNKIYIRATGSIKSCDNVTNKKARVPITIWLCIDIYTKSWSCSVILFFQSSAENPQLNRLRMSKIESTEVAWPCREVGRGRRRFTPVDTSAEAPWSLTSMSWLPHTASGKNKEDLHFETKRSVSSLSTETANDGEW